MRAVEVEIESQTITVGGGARVRLSPRECLEAAADLARAGMFAAMVEGAEKAEAAAGDVR